MKRSKTILLVISAFILVFSSLVYAGVPQMISYQGKITKPSGALVDTTISMVFKIYDAATEGNVLWTETQSSVVVEKGIFSVLLGSVSEIPDSVFDGNDRYLGLKVGGDSEMSPRKKIVSVGYAFHSKHADTDDDWTASDTNIYRLQGNVCIGASGAEGTKLYVKSEANNSTAVIGMGEGDGSVGVYGAAVSTSSDGSAIGVKGYAVPGFGGSDIYGGYFYTLGLTGADRVYGVYAKGHGYWTSDTTFGVWATASRSPVNFAIYAAGPPEDSGFVSFFQGGKNYFSGKVGVGTTTPQGALDVSSTTGAFIVPRMTTTQRNALTPVNGMIIYNTTADEFNFYEDGAWVTK